MLKRIFIDVETTGLSPQKNTIWQIAGIIIKGGTIDEFDFRCCPLHNKEVEEKALETANVTREILAKYNLPKNILAEFKDKLSCYVDPYNKSDKFVMYGYNVGFDADMLRQWFADLHDNYYGSWFFHPPVDIMVLAAEHLRNERHKLVNFKLGTVAKHLGIVVDDATLHDALVDIRLTFEIYKRVKGA